MPRTLARAAMLSLDDLRVGARLLAALPGFLRAPLTLERSRQLIRERRERRGAHLVDAVKRAASRQDSPYARLLAHAGCGAGEIAEMVAREGVEGALHALARAGVFLAVDELKGRRPVRRGSLELTVDPATLVDPRAVVHGLAESSGSRGAPTPVPIDLAFVADHAVNTQLALAAYGGGEWRHAHYGVPGGTAVTNPLELAKGGRPPDRWFTPVPLDVPGLSARYRAGWRALWLGSRLAGVPLPSPITAPLDDPMPIVEWMSGELARGRIPHLWTFASSAVRVCQAALDAGGDLAGARFTAGGEPTTPARRAAIEAAGAVALPRMGATETDILAYACARPTAADDMHFFDDRHALVQPGEAAAEIGLPARAMLLTSLLPTAPIALVNVSLGDQAKVDRRACGCGLEADGWTVHLREVRSFEKLTAGGVALLDVDVARVLEEVLPARFCGRPADYQLVERLDGARARPEVRLVVEPSLGPLDERRLGEEFLAAIAGGAGGERLMGLQWRGGGVLAIERSSPRRTPSGKVLHVHLEHRQAPER